MKRIVLGVALAWVAVPVAASDNAAMNFRCPARAATPAPAPDLTGSWDMVMDVGGVPNFGLISVGRVDGRLAGSIALHAGVAAVRSLTSDGQAVALIVATGEGDVRFDGSLTADGRRMCGIVTYHDGRKLAMVAQKRPAREAGVAAAQAGQAAVRR